MPLPVPGGMHPNFAKRVDCFAMNRKLFSSDGEVLGFPHYSHQTSLMLVSGVANRVSACLVNGTCQ